MRQTTLHLAVTVLDTTAMSRPEVATAVLDWCRRTLNGDTRTLHVTTCPA